jgi:hypothetical protein
VNGPPFTLKVSGTGFTTNSKIVWNDSECSTIFTSATELSTTIPSEYIANPGTVTITVWDPNGISESVILTISDPLPTITSISPNSGRRGTTGSYTIYGLDFVSGASAKLVRSSSTIECLDESVQNNGGRMTCRISIPSRTSTGYWDVVVTNPDGKIAVKKSAFRIK